MIAAGTRLGVYEVLAPLGAGGMGEVYRARDTRLGREVALKVLPPELAAQPSSLERFEQEARHVAALNHPNIVALFDVGTDAGVAYIVTELVDGETLGRGTFTPRKVAEIGAQIADALAAAHGAGVTHRDIKPDNVILTREGRVKVLDFGVAKAAPRVPSNQTTFAQTEINAVVGTAGYMAPEQVRGETVDPRTDIFAVGVVLHELLSGATPFRGETGVEIMTATLRAEPPDLPGEVPEGMRHIVRRCLEKNPEERFQSARDLAFALRQLTGSSASSATIPAVASRRARAPVWIGVAAFVLGALTAGIAVLRWWSLRENGVTPVQLTRITADRRSELAPVFSPDGRSLAYIRMTGTATDLLVRSLDSLTPIALVSSPTRLRNPVWSADGNQVCYTQVRELWCVGAAGGASRRILAEVSNTQIARDGSVFFIRAVGNGPWLFRSAPGSEAQRLGSAALPMDTRGLSPVSPDGSSIIVYTASDRWLVSLPDGVRHALPHEPGVRTRSIGWFPDSRTIAVAEETTTLIGSRLVVEDVRSHARRLILQTADPIDALTVARDGARIVHSGGPVERDIVEYSATGTFVRNVATSSLLEGFPEWAPGGDRLVYRAGGPGQIDSLWIGDSDASATLVQRLSSNTGSRTPVSPDGKRIAYVEDDGVSVVSTQGGRSVRVVSAAHPDRMVCWSADGESIWYSEGPAHLAKVPSAGGAPVTIQTTPGILIDCSPDGRSLLRGGRGRLVLTSTDGKSERPIPDYHGSGGEDVYSVRFADGGRSLLAIGADGRTIDVVDVESGMTRRTIAFDLPQEDRIYNFAMHPSGTRVLLNTGGERNDLWMVEGFPRPAGSWRRWFGLWESR